MRGIEGRSRPSTFAVISGLVLVAGMLGFTGYLLRLRAEYRDRVIVATQELRLSQNDAGGHLQGRALRAEFYVNQSLLSLPERQALVTASLIRIIQRKAEPDWNIRSAGMGMRFRIDPKGPHAKELAQSLLASPYLLRLDRCRSGKTCVRGVVEIP